MGRLGQHYGRDRRRLSTVSSRSLLAALLLLPLLAGCSGSTGTAAGSTGADTGSEAAGPTDSQLPAETTAGSADGADSACTRTPPETIGRLLDLTPAGAPESIEGDPLVLIGAPRGLVSFTGCSLPFTGAGLDPDQKLTVTIFSADGGHDDFERIRSSVTSKATPVPDLGDEAFTAMTLQTLVIARKDAKIVVVGYLVQNEENTIKVAREVLGDL
jgi:hypothetical protein